MTSYDTGASIVATLRELFPLSCGLGGIDSVLDYAYYDKLITLGEYECARMYIKESDNE